VNGRSEMNTSGPIIEELPDDYEIETPTKDVERTATSSAVRRGFFNRQRPRRVEEPPELATPGTKATKACATTSSGGLPASGSTDKQSCAQQKPSKADEAGEGEVQEPGTSSRMATAGSEEDLPDPKEFVGGLRQRLRAATSAASECSKQMEVIVQRDQAVESKLSSLTTQARWPTAQMRSARDKATAEVDLALAELRAASNDARRLRGGDEKRVVSELKRATEDALDRVRKVSDLVAPKKMTPEDRSAAVAAAFHAMPLPAKLRVLADNGVAVGLLGASFAVGMTLMVGILLEVYTTCNCGLRCGA